jgi:hypothetical protein
VWVDGDWRGLPSNGGQIHLLDRPQRKSDAIVPAGLVLFDGGQDLLPASGPVVAVMYVDLGGRSRSPKGVPPLQVARLTAGQHGYRIADLMESRPGFVRVFTPPADTTEVSFGDGYSVLYLGQPLPTGRYALIINRTVVPRNELYEFEVR